jgi:hypothetical protein
VIISDFDAIATAEKAAMGSPQPGAIDDVQCRRLRTGEVAAANKSGTPLAGNNSLLFGGHSGIVAETDLIASLPRQPLCPDLHTATKKVSDC